MSQRRCTFFARAAPTIPANPGGANEFSTEALAKGRCPTDIVVWANLKSNVYTLQPTAALPAPAAAPTAAPATPAPGRTRFYGETKNGAYMCERDSLAEGMRAAKNEIHP